MKDDDTRPNYIVEAVELERHAISLEELLVLLKSNYDKERREVEHRLVVIRMRQGELNRKCGVLGVTP